MDSMEADNQLTIDLDVPMPDKTMGYKQIRVRNLEADILDISLRRTIRTLLLFPQIVDLSQSSRLIVIKTNFRKPWLQRVESLYQSIVSVISTHGLNSVL